MKNVLITGAAKRLGRDLAIHFGKKGFFVWVHYNNSKKEAEEVLQLINSSDGTGELIQGDISQYSQAKSIAKKIKLKGRFLDVLINNAGLMPLSFVKILKVEEWERMIDVNIKGVLYCTAAVLPNMLVNGSGHIINISSVAGRIVFPAGSVYCATKHAVTAFSEGLRQELSPRKNIRITSIEPGVVETELNKTITDESLTKFLENTKNMEGLKAEDISNAIVFAIDAPNHVSVNEILVRPTTQER